MLRVLAYRTARDSNSSEGFDMVAPTPSGYSANVRLELLIGGRPFPLGQIGGGNLIFDEPIVLPGTAGEVFAYIDEHVQRWHVTWNASETPRQVIAAEFREVAYTPAPASTITS